MMQENISNGVVVADEIDVGQRDGFDHGGANVAEADVAHHARRLGRATGALRAEADRNGAGDVGHHQVRECDVLESGFAVAPHLDGAAVDFVNQAVRHRDVARVAAAEAEDAPAGAEGAVGDRDELAASEERAGIVLALHVAIADVDEAAGNKRARSDTRRRPA
jgi:hypothetical protein